MFSVGDKAFYLLKTSGFGVNRIKYIEVTVVRVKPKTYIIKLPNGDIRSALPHNLVKERG